MKSFIGVILSRLEALKSAELSEPIHLAFSYDEEIGCVGAISLVEAITEEGLAPRGCIVGEPSSMRAIRGHKSMNVFRVEFHGVAAHSRSPRRRQRHRLRLEFVAFVHAVLPNSAPRDRSMRPTSCPSPRSRRTRSPAASP